MTTFKGFSTIGVNQPKQLVRAGVFGGVGSLNYTPVTGKKFLLTDDQLVIRDLLNALSIQQGSKVGQPEYGTTLWSYMFETLDDNTLTLIETEVRRVISNDSRINLESVKVYAQENGVLLQIEMTFSPYNQPVTVDFFLNKFDGSISQIAQ